MKRTIFAGGRAVPTPPPLFSHGVLLALALALGGCGMLGGKKNADAAQDGQATEAGGATQGAVAFDVDVRSSDRAIARHLRQHLNLQRYRRFPDLRTTEFNRLMHEADANARDLLAALGYFNPELKVRVEDGSQRAQAQEQAQVEAEAQAKAEAEAAAAQEKLSNVAAGDVAAVDAAVPEAEKQAEKPEQKEETPEDEDAAVAGEGSAPRTIVVEVEPGPQTKVASHAIAFEGDVATSPAAERQKARIERRWSLKEGDGFAQTEWAGAKNAGLRELQKLRYPTARIAHSEARVDADANRADLQVRYDSGEAYRFGPLKLEGVERYDAEGIENIVRIPTGADYSEEALLDAQQRLVNSGYFDSAFLMIDTDSEPQNATVVAQLREAKYQKLVFGVGLSTDAGLRLSMDHVHNKLWPLGWRAVSQVAVDMKTQKASTQWTAMPNRSGWAWYLGAGLTRADVGDFKNNSFSLIGGRSKSVGHIDRRYYLQYDMAKVTGDANGSGSDLLGSSSSLLASYSWTGRYFNNKNNPTRGYGLGAELGAGYTLTPEQKPFVRTRLRALNFWQLGQPNPAGRRSRLAVRGELGAIVADSDTRVPASLLFLTGGDTTVRGYSYESIGTRSDSGKLYGGRYMGVASLEWQRPITLMGNVNDWESAVFVDTGAISNHAGSLKLHTGVGTGIRWNSPVGPMQADVAYGVQDKQIRLHLRMGFTF